ncbi:hypothetical protein [Sphingomonas paucimobilis]|nr:hypothetical protein [Sphingomonas paucimobilis]SUJ08183.1 Uncharacterised protein [Sphingomonas paucimobilis]
MMKQEFGSWLVAQHNRDDWVGLLGFQARRDRAFPTGGDPDDVRAYMQRKGADHDTLDMLDTAELEWGRA